MPGAFADDDRCPACQAVGFIELLVHADQEPEMGAWCPHCLLPSAATIGLTVRCQHGWPTSLTVPPAVVCLDCQRNLSGPHPA